MSYTDWKLGEEKDQHILWLVKEPNTVYYFNARYYYHSSSLGYNLHSVTTSLHLTLQASEIWIIIGFLLGNSPVSEFKIQMPGNYPEESIQHSEHGESLKSRIL
jgi:hypothetical protein